MNRLTLPSFLLALCFVFGCGIDGREGTSYLAFNWDWYVDSYWDNNPGVPSTINAFSDYRVNPRTYSYEYACSDGLGDYWGYEGTYSIRFNNSGESASLFRDGDNGRDRYHLFFLGGFGSTFSVDERSIPEPQKEPKTIIHKQPLAVGVADREYIGEPIIETQVYNSVEITVSKRLFRFVNE
jgi:hypothetical protein